MQKEIADKISSDEDIEILAATSINNRIKLGEIDLEHGLRIASL